MNGGLCIICGTLLVFAPMIAMWFDGVRDEAQGIAWLYSRPLGMILAIQAMVRIGYALAVFGVGLSSLPK